MKKIISILLVMVLALGVFAGCGAKTELEGTTVEILEKINENAEVQFPLGTDNIDAENPSYHTGLTTEFYAENVAEGAYSEAMIGSQAHSMIILKVKDGVNPEDVASKIFTDLKPNKWICVTAEHMYVNTSGDYVFMVMSYADATSTIIPAFEALAGTVGDAQEQSNKE